MACLIWWCVVLIAWLLGFKVGFVVLCVLCGLRYCVDLHVVVLRYRFL